MARSSGYMWCGIRLGLVTSMTYPLSNVPLALLTIGTTKVEIFPLPYILAC